MTKREEFTKLYTEFAPGLLKLCLGYTGDKAQAEDLLQDSFVAVWNNMDKFRRESSWSTWIYRIAVNTCLSHLKSNKKKVVDLEHPVVSLLPDDRSEKEQEVQVLYKSISRLKEADRLLIAMVLEDKTYPEIAAILGITETNLRVRIHRAKAQLIEIYNQYERL